MFHFLLSLMVFNAITAGLQHAQVEQQPGSAQAQYTEQVGVLLYRKAGLLAMFADVDIGDKHGYFLTLGNNRYSLIQRPAGWQTLWIKVAGQAIKKQKIYLNQGKINCIELKPIVEMSEPLSAIFHKPLSTGFILKLSPCPDLTGLKQTSRRPQYYD